MIEKVILIALMVAAAAAMTTTGTEGKNKNKKRWDVDETEELEEAFLEAEAGDTIVVMPSFYQGHFRTGKSGTKEEPIVVFGVPGAVIDGGGWEIREAGLRITGSHWKISSILVQNSFSVVVL